MLSHYERNVSLLFQCDIKYSDGGGSKKAFQSQVHDEVSGLSRFKDSEASVDWSSQFRSLKQNFSWTGGDSRVQEEYI